MPVLAIAACGVLFVTTIVAASLQAPFTTVQVKEYTPPVNPVTEVLVCKELTITTGLPLDCDQYPVFGAGSTALNVMVGSHVSKSAPTVAVTPLLLITTSSKSVHPSAFAVTVQRKVFTPASNPVTEVLYKDGVVMLAVFPIEVHTPVPIPETSLPSRFGQKSLHVV